MSARIRRRFGSRVLMLAMAAVLLTDCAQLDHVGAKLGLGSGPLAEYPNDACGADRRAFSDAPNFMTERIVTTAIATTAGGAVAGAGVAAATHGNILTGAAVGAGIGLVAGLVGGYISGLQQQTSDRRVLADHVNMDLNRESSGIDHVAAQFGLLRECRFRQAARIKGLARAGRIDPDSARGELAFQRDRFSEEIALARTYNVNMEKHEGQFQYAATTLRKNNAPNSAGLQHLATETIPEKRGAFDNSVERADSCAKVAFNLDTGDKSTFLFLPVLHA